MVNGPSQSGGSCWRGRTLNHETELGRVQGHDMRLDLVRSSVLDLQLQMGERLVHLLLGDETKDRQRGSE